MPLACIQLYPITSSTMYQRLLNLSLAGLIVLAAAGSLRAQYSITALNTPVTENFDGQTATTSATGGTATPSPIFTLPGLANWQGIRYQALNPSGMTPQVYGGSNDGTSGVGGIYNVGATGNSNRMLGSTADGNTGARFGTRFTNNTGVTITSLRITFTQAQWRNGVESTQNESWQFGYRINATDLNTGIYTAVSQLDLTEINVGSTSAAAVDGYSVANQSVKDFTISLSLAAGATIYLRWTDGDAGLVGGDALMAIDNLTVTATVGTGSESDLAAASGIDAVSVYANPTSGRVNVDFTLSRAEKVKVSLVDAAGATREVLMAEQSLEAGAHSRTLNTTSASGLYFVAVETSRGRRIQKLLIVK
jgi:hypothetical protein